MLEASLDGRARAEAVLVGVDEPRADALERRVGLVRAAVAVLVGARQIADLDAVRMDEAIPVVAVGRVRDVASRWRARRRHRVGVAVRVAVGVPVERLGEIVVDRAVAVVVEPVAALGRAREDGGVRVVAVGVRQAAVLVEVDGVEPGEPVAVAVSAVVPVAALAARRGKEHTPQEGSRHGTLLREASFP